MQDLFTSTEVVILINKIKDKYIALTTEIAEKYELNFRDADVFSFFAFHKEFDTPIECVNYKGYSKTYVSKSLDILLSKGLIDMRRTTDGDQRYVHVVTTPKSRSLINDLGKARDNLNNMIVDGLSPEEIKVFAELIGKIGKNKEIMA